MCRIFKDGRVVVGQIYIFLYFCECSSNNGGTCRDCEDGLFNKIMVVRSDLSRCQSLPR